MIEVKDPKDISEGHELDLLEYVEPLRLQVGTSRERHHPLRGSSLRPGYLLAATWHALGIWAVTGSMVWRHLVRSQLHRAILLAIAVCHWTACEDLEKVVQKDFAKLKIHIPHASRTNVKLGMVHYRNDADAEFAPFDDLFENGNFEISHDDHRTGFRKENSVRIALNSIKKHATSDQKKKIEGLKVSRDRTFVMEVTDLKSKAYRSKDKIEEYLNGDNRFSKHFIRNFEMYGKNEAKDGVIRQVLDVYLIAAVYNGNIKARSKVIGELNLGPLLSQIFRSAIGLGFSRVTDQSIEGEIRGVNVWKVSRVKSKKQKEMGWRFEVSGVVVGDESFKSFDLGLEDLDLPDHIRYAVDDVPSELLSKGS